MCFTKHPFRRTVPLQLHEDLSDAQCSSDSVNPREDTFADAATELSFAEFFERCILSKALPPRHIPLPQAHWYCNSINISSGCNGLMPVPRTQPDCTLPPPPGLEDRALLGSHHNILTKAAPVRPHSHKNACSQGTPNPPTSTPTLQPQVSTTQVGTHTACSSATHKRSASTALAGTHSAIGADPRAGRGLFPEPRPVVLPVVRFGLPKPAGLGHLHNADSDLVHHQFRLCVLQWNPGPARRNPTQIIAATCGRIHAVISQEASDHVPHVSDQFIAYTGNTDLAVLLNNDTFKPNPAVYAFQEASSSKDTCGMVLLIVRGLLRRPSLSGTPAVQFCSVHIHNVVAKKRDASTDLLRRLHAHMQQHNVDFIGGDFNMSAFSTVGDVFADPQFSAWCAGGGESRVYGVSHCAQATIRVVCGFTWLPHVQQRGSCTWAS